MAANPIYIETEEEIPEVIERVRRTAAEDVPLVLPTRSRFGQSRFNFQLLRQYTSQMGKRISIVSPDPAVQQMAEESGFRTFRAVEQLGGGAAQAGAAAAPAAIVLPPARRPAARPLAGAAGGAAAAPPRIAVGAPSKLPSRLATEVKPGRFLLYAGAGVLLVVGLVAMALYVPAATVTLTVDATAFKQDNLQVDAAPGTPPVRVRVQTVAQQASAGFKATGVKTIPGTVATGTVVFHNSCSFQRITILDGQRMRGTGGIQFAVKGNIGPMDPGQAGAGPITATSPGASGNLPAGAVGVIENNQAGCLTASNPDATTGGADEQKKTVIQTQDVETARSSLDAQLRKQIGDDLTKQVQNGEKLSDQVVFQPADFASDHKVGDEVGNFNATMKLSGEGAYYMAADINKAFADLLTRKVPAEKQLTDNQIKTDYAITNASSGGHLTFKGSASAFLAPKIDFDQVKSRLVGRTLGTAQHDLGRLPVKSVEIKESPFRLPLMPLQSSRINIRYVVEQVPASTPPASG